MAQSFAEDYFFIKKKVSCVLFLMLISRNCMHYRETTQDQRIYSNDIFTE